MSGPEVARILARRADLSRQIAECDEALAAALQGGQEPEREDQIFGLVEAAAHVGEPVSTFRQRLAYRRALVSPATARRLRFSRRALDRILSEQLTDARAEAPARTH